MYLIWRLIYGYGEMCSPLLLWYGKDSYGDMTQETNRLGDRETYQYDKEARLTGKTGYAGKKVLNEYTDSAGTVTTRYSDGASRVIVRDLAGNILKATGSTGVISYRYDGNAKRCLSP
jgi:YD repeat-containing protein